jgi:hypothetical protein
VIANAPLFVVVKVDFHNQLAPALLDQYRLRRQQGYHLGNKVALYARLLSKTEP